MKNLRTYENYKPVSYLCKVELAYGKYHGEETVECKPEDSEDSIIKKAWKKSGVEFTVGEKNVRAEIVSKTPVYEDDKMYVESKNNKLNMRYLKEYNDKFSRTVDTARRFKDTSFYHGINNIASVVDDILSFDFKSLTQSFVNKEGFNKLTDLLFELGLLKKATDQKDFEDIDIVKYGIDISLILELLEDEDVKKYLSVDKKLSKRIEKNYQYLIDWLKEEEKKS